MTSTEFNLTSSELEEFLILGKTLKGTSLIPLITRSLNHPKIFNYFELLNLPNIIELKNNQDTLPYYNLLKLFSIGTLKDYQESNMNFPELNNQQLKKLKILTLLSCCSDKKKLSYSILLKQLDINNIRELEDIIIEAIFNDLIKGKMNQKEACLYVDHCLGRDIDLDNHHNIIDDMIQKLNQWLDTSELLSQSLQHKIDRAQSESKLKYSKSKQDSKSREKSSAPSTSGAMDCD